jgi:hypothetical protein
MFFRVVDDFISSTPSTSALAVLKIEIAASR